MALKRWDPINNTTLYNPKDFDEKTGAWVRKVKFPKGYSFISRIA